MKTRKATGTGKKSNRPGETDFAVAVREKLKTLNTTLTAVSRQIGVPHGTVRQWLLRDSFPRNGLIELASELGLPTDANELQRKYSIARIYDSGRRRPAGSGLREPFRILQQRLEGVSHNLTSDVEFFLRALKDDIFLFWSLDELPLEMTNLGWAAIGNSMAAAIDRGVSCIYIHPDEQALSTLRKQGLPKLPVAERFESAFTQLVQNLRAAELRDIETGKSKFLSPDQISERVIRVAAPYTGFAAPHHKYVVYHSAGSTRALAQFPTGNGRDERALLPLEEGTAIELYDYLTSCLRAAEGSHRTTPAVKTLVPFP